MFAVLSFLKLFVIFFLWANEPFLWLKNVLMDKLFDKICNF